MGRKKYKMPSNKYFLKKKRNADPRKDPVWVYLKREMLANVDKKPYNKKVDRWLNFLKDLKGFYRCERLLAKRKLVKECGPRWFIEFSSHQRVVLEGFKEAIHRADVANFPCQVRQLLSNLGITRKFPSSVLMKAVYDSVSDPGVFLWNLFEYIYKTPPNVLLKKYDLDGMILMSSFVFLDLEDCLKCLDELTRYKKKPIPPVVPKKKKKKGIPNIRFGEYLQKNYVTLYSNNRPVGPKKRAKPKPLGTKCKFRSEESYTKLRLAPDFLVKRRKQHLKAKQIERTCNYNFWEPPSSLRNTDPKKAAYVEKLKLLKVKANKRFQSPYKNLEYEVTGVSLVGNRPQYILGNNVQLPTGYTIINGGIVKLQNGEAYTNIQGNWDNTRKLTKGCRSTCDCLEKWEQKAIDYGKKSTCKCNHNYDFYHTGKCKNRYFHPATRNGPFWVDHAKVFEINPIDEFVRDYVHNAVRSESPTPNDSLPSIPLATISKKKLLKALLADISDTPLIIPHLPQAHLLNILLEWVRKRVRGKLTPKQDRKNKLLSQRRWLQLKHLEFRSNCSYIPFTKKQLKHMNFDHRGQINKLLEILFESFVRRNRVKLVEQSRLMWPTTKTDAYPQKAFLDMYFTYLPSRVKDYHLINPYGTVNTIKPAAKTCPINI